MRASTLAVAVAVVAVAVVAVVVVVVASSLAAVWQSPAVREHSSLAPAVVHLAPVMVRLAPAVVHLAPVVVHLALASAVGQHLEVELRLVVAPHPASAYPEAHWGWVAADTRYYSSRGLPSIAWVDTADWGLGQHTVLVHRWVADCQVD